ncbi:MAG: hypothetical protein MOB07_22480 [Acidobacteria bacterium]|nr:hypothetical protein [Acidobacteriota bacterium]MCI0666286.1 hypothetical protein [Acidobacteriota bacterium]
MSNEEVNEIESSETEAISAAEAPSEDAITASAENEEAVAAADEVEIKEEAIGEESQES